MWHDCLRHCGVSTSGKRWRCVRHLRWNICVFHELYTQYHFISVLDNMPACLCTNNYVLRHNPYHSFPSMIYSSTKLTLKLNVIYIVLCWYVFKLPSALHMSVAKIFGLQSRAHRISFLKATLPPGVYMYMLLESSKGSLMNIGIQYHRTFIGNERRANSTALRQERSYKECPIKNSALRKHLNF